MIFIDKTTIHSNESRNRLEILKTGFRHKGKTLEKLYGVANQSGGKLWKLGLDKSVLRQDLHKEQGGICCYCCQKLSFQIDNNKFDHHTKIEHFLIKSAPDVDKSQEKQAFRERLYNYDNLMLACAGGETYEIKTKNRYGRLDTKNDVAELLGVSVETLDELNPNATYTAGKHIKYVENKQQYCDTKRNEGTFRIFNNNKYPDFKALLEKRKKETPQYLPREKDIIPIVNPSAKTASAPPRPIWPVQTCRAAASNSQRPRTERLATPPRYRRSCGSPGLPTLPLARRSYRFRRCR